MSGVFPSHFPPYMFEDKLSVGIKFTGLARTAVCPSCHLITMYLITMPLHSSIKLHSSPICSTSSNHHAVFLYVFSTSLLGLGFYLEECIMYSPRQHNQTTFKNLCKVMALKTKHVIVLSPKVLLLLLTNLPAWWNLVIEYVQCRNSLIMQYS